MSTDAVISQFFENKNFCFSLLQFIFSKDSVLSVNNVFFLDALIGTFNLQADVTSYWEKKLFS